MIATEFFFIADRGALKVYLLSTTSTPKLRLAETISINGARKKYSDEYTDQAGAFPSRGANVPGTSIAERNGIEIEHKQRSFREAARKITEILRANQPRRWSFAAPAEINHAILDEVPNDLQSRLAHNLKKDLVNTPAPEVLAHFRKAA